MGRYYWEHPNAGPIPPINWILNSFGQPMERKGLGYVIVYNDEDEPVDRIPFHSAKQYNLIITQTDGNKVKVYMYEPGVFGINDTGTGGTKSV